MTPSERARRIEAGMRAWVPLGSALLTSRRTVASILDAADEAVPVVSEAEYSAEVNDRVRLSLNVTRDAWEEMEQQAERAEAAARDFWKALRILDDWHHDEPTYLLITEVRDRHPSFSGEEGTDA